MESKKRDSFIDESQKEYSGNRSETNNQTTRQTVSKSGSFMRRDRRNSKCKKMKVVEKFVVY